LYCFISGVSADSLGFGIGVKIISKDMDGKLRGILLLINIYKTIFAEIEPSEHMRKLTMPELNRMTVDEFKATEKTPIVVVLDNIRSQNNTGSVFRTADAFRLEGVYLCGFTATPPHPEIRKTALGSTESVDWQYFATTTSAIKQLMEQGYHIIAVEQTEGSIFLQDYHPPAGIKIAVIFGNEVNGVEDEVLELAEQCLEIPQFGTKHSINVSVAVGIVVWDLFLKMKIA
jgi:tRNA G18 (ribose-2'-O)-methylase SpoU